MSKQDLSLKRVIIKGIFLFILVDLLFVQLAPLQIIGRLSAYNYIFPGRVRLPYGENPDQSYNLSLFNLDAMFASLELAKGNKLANEYRILLLGDSSVWGYLLKPKDTLSGVINTAGLKTGDGRSVHAYNLGYPTLALTKDLLILDQAMHYQPDLIIWLVTLESFPVNKQLDSPILQNNSISIQRLINKYRLNLDFHDPRLILPDFFGSTLIGQRRNLADILRLQIYGVMWSATGIDQYYPASYEPPQSDLIQDETFQGLLPPNLLPQDLSMDVLSTGKIMAGNVPILFVNEPIYISNGENSDIRYNFFYPKWAYDQYRQLMVETCRNENWLYLDEWNLVPPAEFTNSAIHMSPIGTQLLASELLKSILSISNP